nr:hypothetical protein [Tanacetum cinerariifolium]
MQDDEVEPAELKEVVEVVTIAKLITEVVTAASATITAAAPQPTTTAAPTLTTAPSAAIRRKRVVIRDPEETATPSTIIHFEGKSKDKGKGILVEEPKPLKKQAQIEQDEADARKLEAMLNKNIDWDKVAELKRHLQIVPNDEDDVYTEATPLAPRCTSSNLEKSKKCLWSSEGQKLEAVRVLWCADYHIYYNTVDFAGREEISTYKVHSESTDQ